MLITLKMQKPSMKQYFNNVLFYLHKNFCDLNKTKETTLDLFAS